MAAKNPTVLVVGSCGLDRLLTVAEYPKADAKVRSKAYNQVGGGNAANTAAAMGRLTGASVLQASSIQVKILTKVGDDAVGQQLIDELKDSGVDTSFVCNAPKGSITAVTTVIVSESDHSRTCIHNPGTTGPLEIEEVKALGLDNIFENVVHLHSDSRLTEASLFLAREAKVRGIPISCDCEKDRSTKALDDLIEISDILFTNSSYLGSYIHRLSAELSARYSRKILPEPSIITPNISDDVDAEEKVDIYTASLGPSSFFSRWYCQTQKEVVVTHGRRGALHYTVEDRKESATSVVSSHEISVSKSPNGVKLLERFMDTNQEKDILLETVYNVINVGVLKDLNIVDSTGAGDAFIGGYIISTLLSAINDDSSSSGGGSGGSGGISSNKKATIEFAMKFGSWVGGRKLEGPGA